MEDETKIREILKKSRTVAVYGISTNPEKPAHSVPAFLLAQGFHIIPVNPNADEILGQRCFHSLREIPEMIEVVQVFRPSDQVRSIVQEAMERKREKGDIAVIWLQEGIQNPAAQKLAEEAGILMIQDKCMKKEFQRYSGFDAA